MYVGVALSIMYVSVSDQFVKCVPLIIYIKHTRAYFFLHTYVRAYLFICCMYICMQCMYALMYMHVHRCRGCVGIREKGRRR